VILPRKLQEKRGGREATARKEYRLRSLKASREQNQVAPAGNVVRKCFLLQHGIRAHHESVRDHPAAALDYLRTKMRKKMTTTTTTTIYMKTQLLRDDLPARL
jgi:hypothetical protein